LGANDAKLPPTRILPPACRANRSDITSAFDQRQRDYRKTRAIPNAGHAMLVKAPRPKSRRPAAPRWNRRTFALTEAGVEPPVPGQREIVLVAKLLVNRRRSESRPAERRWREYSRLPLGLNRRSVDVAVAFQPSDAVARRLEPFLASAVKLPPAKIFHPPDGDHERHTAPGRELTSATPVVRVGEK
jgi:hypothetical protein